MGVLDRFRRRKKERKEDIQKTGVNTPQQTRGTIKRTEDKRIEKPKLETKGISTQVSVPKRLTPSETQVSPRVEKTKILEGYKIKDASTHEWQDESSHKAEERLKKVGIQNPWHYNDTFGEDFKVLALRAGGVGAVIFVKFTRFGERIYAAKTLQRFLQRDYLEMPTYQQKKIADDFLEEALPWLEMGQHPNIIPVYRLENIIHPATKRNVPFVFSTFIEEGDLRNLLLEKGRFDLEEALCVGLQVCEALLHAYKHGLSAHKDLKPENIMVYKEGIYKVTDFSAGVLGTPGYMAPEQVASRFKLKDNIAIDQSADQFALGLITLELLLGERPFPWIKRAVYSKEEAEKFLRDGAGKIPDNLPGSLRGMIERCLSPDSANRFHGLSALKEALLEVYRTEFGGDYHFPEVEIDDSPEWWWLNRGMAFCNIGRHASAVIPFKEALRRFRRIPGTEISQARCLTNLGSVYNSTGKFSEAADNLKEALRIFKAIPGTEIDQASCLTNLGNVYNSTGKFSEVEANYNEALRIFKAIPGTEIDQARCLTNLGNVYDSTGKFSEAADNLKEALRIFKAIPGTEIDQARCLANLGTVYRDTGKFSEAEANYNEALRIFKAIPGTEIKQAECLTGMGTVYRSTGKFSEAEYNLKEVLRMYKAIPGTEIDQTRCLTSLGNVYRSTGKFSEAEANYNEALWMYKVIPGTEIKQANCLTNLGNVYGSTDEFYEAEANYKEALRMYKAIPGTEIKQANCLTNLGRVYQSTGKFSDAEANYKEVLRRSKVLPGIVSEIDQANCLMNLGNVYQSTGKFSDAETNYKEALRMCKAIPSTEIDQATCLMNLGIVYARTNKLFEAEDNFKEALRMYNAIPGTEIRQAGCLMNLGILYNMTQEFSKVRSMLKDALEICEQYPMGTEQIKNACLKVLSQIP
jgi:tetratricopeptide (TPR) repeat protein